MRFLIINTCYDRFIRWFYEQHPELACADYQTQLDAHNESFFGIGDAYTINLRALGHEAVDVHANVRPLQMAWAKEHGVTASPPDRWSWRLRRGFIPWLSRVRDQRWLYEILAAQIEHYQPDVILNHDLYLDAGFFRELRPKLRLLIGQHAADLPKQNLSGYDLILSSLPHQVDHFRKLSIPSRLFRLGFDPTILQHLTPWQPRYDVVFVGSISNSHAHGTRVLEQVCRRINSVRVFGIGAENLSAESALRRCYGGPLWGLAMYQALRDARIILNRHLDAAGPFANNMRLYETTGIGAFLLTDEKRNLANMFGPGREVATYRDAEDCVRQIDHYLAHEGERQTIARNGQERTLREHTYSRRMNELVSIIEDCLTDRRSPRVRQAA